MPISLGTGLAVLTFLVSLLILSVSAWNLYLSHYKEQRSDIDLLPEETDSLPVFSGGNQAIDDDALWTGNFYLKIVNSGAKGSYIGSFDHSLEGLKKGDRVYEPDDATIEVNETRMSWAGTEIEPRSSKRYRVSAKIMPETDLGVLVDHDSAIIRHVLKVEDNQGSYEVIHQTEMELVGPEGAIENWRETQELG